jgi:hypothetical protein
MKEEVRLLIKDLQYACSQSLFDGIVRTAADDDDTDTKDRTFQGSSETNITVQHAAKRQRRDGDKATYKSESWDTVSPLILIIFHIFVYLYLTLLSEIISLIQSLVTSAFFIFMNIYIYTLFLLSDFGPRKYTSTIYDELRAWSSLETNWNNVAWIFTSAIYWE